jgi:hypothetical protein
LPHAPQFATSLVTSTQLAPHLSSGLSHDVAVSLVPPVSLAAELSIDASEPVTGAEVEGEQPRIRASATAGLKRSVIYGRG